MKTLAYTIRKGPLGDPSIPGSRPRIYVNEFNVIVADHKRMPVMGCLCWRCNAARQKKAKFGR